MEEINNINTEELPNSRSRRIYDILRKRKKKPLSFIAELVKKYASSIVLIIYRGSSNDFGTGVLVLTEDNNLAILTDKLLSEEVDVQFTQYFGKYSAKIFSRYNVVYENDTGLYRFINEEDQISILNSGIIALKIKEKTTQIENLILMKHELDELEISIYKLSGSRSNFQDREKWYIGIDIGTTVISFHV